MAVGAAVASYFGLTGTAAAVTAGVVNGALIGAAVGAATAAVSGGDIGEGIVKGALTGAIAGGAMGYIGTLGETAGTAGATGEAGQTAQLAGQTAIETPVLGVSTDMGIDPSLVGGAPVAPSTVSSSTVPAGKSELLQVAQMNKNAIAEAAKTNMYGQMTAGVVQGVGEGMAAEAEAEAREKEMDKEIASRQIRGLLSVRPPDRTAQITMPRARTAQPKPLLLQNTRR